MKLNKLFMLFGGVLMTGALLTSCSDDDNSYDVVGNGNNLAFFEAQAMNTVYPSEMVITPAGAILPEGAESTVGKAMQVFFQRPVSKDTRVKVAADPESAQKYLAANGLDYTIVPDEFFDYSKAEVVVPANSTKSEDGAVVEFNEDKVNNLASTEVSNYFAAFSIAEITGDGKPSSNRGVYYALIKNEALSFVENNVQKFSVVHTPSAVVGSVSVEMPYTFSGNLNNTAKIELVRDNSLLDEYNETYGAEAKLMPENILNEENMSVTVAEGTSTSEDQIKISAENEKLAKLDLAQYLAPYRIVVTREDGTVFEDAGRYFLLVDSKEGTINDDATEIIGERVDLSGFTCIKAENLNPDEFNGFQNGYWAFTEKKGSASFVLDFGETLNVTGFNISSYVMHSATVYISTDNATWKELGNTAEHTPVRIPGQSWWDPDQTSYVLYGPMAARYMKVELDLDTENYNWQYRDWGDWGYEYSAVNSIDIYSEGE